MISAAPAAATRGDAVAAASFGSGSGGGAVLLAGGGPRVATVRVGRARIGRAQAASSEEGEKKAGSEKKVEKKKEKTSFFTGFTDALDGSRARSEKDEELISEARDATRSGERMNREQYGALRRKIGGTYKDFFKEYIEVDGDYVDDGWVDKRCRVCKQDTSSEPRTKDAMGRYAHVACLEKEKTGGNFFTRLFGGK